MKPEQKPYHVEAAELGGEFSEIKKLSLPATAKEILAVWDYRKAQLTVDQARNYLHNWRRHFHHRFRRGEKTLDQSRRGRITCMSEIARSKSIKYNEYLSSITKLSDGDLSWRHCRIRWTVAGRDILTVLREDVIWPNKPYGKRSRWPESKTTSYTSHLIRQTRPGTIALYESNEYDFISLAAEKIVAHDLRGNWRQKVLDTLLPGEKYIPDPPVAYKAVAVVGDEYQSIFDGSSYRIGVRRNGTARPEHQGGYYCYRTIEEAQKADVPRSSINLDAPRAILRCEVGGRVICYDGGKRAYSWIEPKEFVA